MFDITQTGVLNRSKPNQEDASDWLNRRNTQCNFDTLLQVISMRSQPEIIKYPYKILMNEEIFNKFGFLYKMDETENYCWIFEFEVQHARVFENGIVEFGALYKDCENVPMIICPEQTVHTSNFLDISHELKNIYFEVA